MATFLDIVPDTRIEKTSFGDVEVPGLSLQGLVTVLKRHPKLFEYFQQEEIEFSFSDILDLGEEIGCDLIAAGLGFPGDEKAIARAKRLIPEDFLLLGIAIFEESFPSGPEAFFEQVLQLMEKAGKAMEQVSPSPSSNSSPASVSTLSPKDTETSSGTPQSSS
jgi:hypothetical protein